MKVNLTVILFLSIWLFTAHIVNAQTSSLQIPLLSDAEASIKSAPEQSIKMFEQIKPNLSQYSIESQVAWYRVAIEAANAQLKLDDGYEYVQSLYESYWQDASNRTKQFISLQFGRYGSINGDLQSASALFACALNYSDDESSRLHALNNLAIVYIQSGEWDKAKETYLAGIELATASNNQRILAAMNNNLGHIWFEKKNTIKAQEAFKTAYIIKTRLGQQTSRLLSLHNLMQSTLLLEDWQQWDLYYPLYERLSDEYAIAEVNAQKRWMNVYRTWKVEQISPDAQSLVELNELAKNIENPASKEFVNNLANEMNLDIPINIQPGKERAKARINFLREVSQVCSKETIGE